MSNMFTREELYDLVWSEPMRELAPKYGVTSMSVTKACKKADIPIPERSYWSRLNAGKTVIKPTLPSRGLGKSNIIKICGKPWQSTYFSDHDLINKPLPPKPVFENSMEDVRLLVAKLVERAPFPKSLSRLHPAIGRMLTEDDLRTQRKIALVQQDCKDFPIFDTPFERRRFKILNSLFSILQYCGMRPFITGKEARGLFVTIGDVDIEFTLDSQKSYKQLINEKAGHIFSARGENDPLILEINHYYLPKSPYPTWQDTAEYKIEEDIQSIAAELIITGEQEHRAFMFDYYFRLQDRKMKLQNSILQEKSLESQRVNEEKRHEEKMLIEQLLTQAKTLRQADEIRELVEKTQSSYGSNVNFHPFNCFTEWKKWALEQADRLDPIKSGKL